MDRIESIRKVSNGKEYAKKLAVFLNWLDSKNVIYENAINHHVREFLHELEFGSLRDEKVLSLQSTVGYLHRCGCWQYPARAFTNAN